MSRASALPGRASPGRTRRAWGVAVGASLVVGASILAAGPEGVSITPPVSTGSTSLLVAANAALLSIGPWFLAVLAIMRIGIAAASRSSANVRAQLRLAAANAESDRLRLVLPTATITFLTVSSALAGAASDGATTPFARALDLAGAGDMRFVVQHEDFVLNSHGGIPAGDAAELERSLSGRVVPMNIALGTVLTPEGSHPPSAALVTLPRASLSSFGLSGPASRSCHDGSAEAVVGKQLGVKPGTAITVDGASVSVARTLDLDAGLGRVIVLGSHEGLGSCVFPETTYSMVAIEPGDAAEAERTLRANGTSFAIVESSELTGALDEFWLGTVSPPQMNLLLQVLMASSIGSVFIGRARALRSRRRNAFLISRGAPRRVLQRASALGVALDCCSATVLAIVPAVALTAIVNSTQFGLAIPVSISSLGAGALAGGLGIAAGAALGEYRMLRSLDVYDELRRGL